MRMLALLLTLLLLHTYTEGTGCDTRPTSVTVTVRSGFVASTGITGSINRFNARPEANVSAADFYGIGDPTRSSYQAWVDALTAPDVIPSSRVALMGGMSEALEDLTEMLESSGLAGDIFPAAEAQIRDADGVVRAIPVGMDTIICLYNKPMHASLGLDPPESFSQLLSYCQTLAQLGIACFGPAVTSTSSTILFDTLAIRLYGADFYESLYQGNVSLTEDARVMEVFRVLSLLTPYASLTDLPSGLPPRVAVPPPRLADLADLDDATVGFVCEASLSGSSILYFPTFTLTSSELGAFRFPFFDLPRRSSPDVDDVSTSIPDPEDPKYRAELGTIPAYAAPLNALNPDAALDFLSFLASPEEQAIVALQSAIFPVRPSLNETVLLTDERKVLTLQILEDVPSLHIRSSTLTGVSEVSTPWVDLIIQGLMASTSQEAMDLVDAHLPSLETLRLSALTQQSSPPLFSHPAGSYNELIVVKLSSRPGAGTGVIFFTLDGSTPTTSSSVATDEGITLSADGTTVIRAFRLEEGLSASAIARSDYTIAIPVPSVTPVPDSSSDSRAVLILAIILPILVVGICLGGAIAYYFYRKKDVTYTLSSDSELVIAKDDLIMGPVVGRGSFGKVYSASWHGTPVAVKEMHQASSAMTRRQLKEFVSEAEVLLKLRHPNVLIILGITLDPPGIVTEYMERGSLYMVLHNPQIFVDSSITYAWANALAAGLYFLHKSGFVHGDFKSLNILLDTTWTVKICDFGLTVAKVTALPATHSVASAIASASQPPTPEPTPRAPRSARVAPRPACDLETGIHTASKVNVGSLLWSAPELLAGRVPPSEMTDAYSLGVTLWEMATRNELYRGSNALAVALDVIRGHRPDVSQVPDTLAPLVPIMQALWNENPEERMGFATAQTMLSSLYSPAGLVFPTTKGHPSGRVTVVHTSVLDFTANLSGPLVESEVAYLLAFEGMVQALTKEHQGLVLSAHLGQSTLVFHTPSSAANFCHSLLAFVHQDKSTEWADRVVCVLDAGDIRVEGRDLIGHKLIMGPVMESVSNIWTFLYGMEAAGLAGLDVPDGTPINAFWIEESSSGGGVFTSPSFAETLVSSCDALIISPLASGSTAVVSLDLASHSPMDSPSSPPSGTNDVRDNSLQLPAVGGMSSKRWSALNESFGTASVVSMATSLMSSNGILPSFPELYQDTIEYAKLVPREVMEILVEEGADGAVMGSYARLYPAVLDGTPVVAKILLKQDQPMKGLAVLAVCTQRSSVAAAVAGPSGVAPVAFCLEPPFVGVVYVRKLAGSLGDVFATVLNGGTRKSSQNSSRIHRSLWSGDLPPYNDAFVLTVVRDLAATLARVHHRTKMGHGSLKPSSILLRVQTPADTGVSTLVGIALSDAAITPIKSNQGTMTVVPSVAYLAPEALRGEEMTPEGDVFIMGTLLFEMLTRTSAFPGDNAIHVATRILSGWRPTLPPDMSSFHADIITACWNPNPSARPSMADLAAAFQQLGHK